MKLLTDILTSDKAFHFLYGFFICSIFSLISPIIGLSAGILAGISKEVIWDKWMKRGQFDWLDLLATVAGTVPAYMILVAGRGR